MEETEQEESEKKQQGWNAAAGVWRMRFPVPLLPSQLAESGILD